jgi:hypothetical protein
MYKQGEGRKINKSRYDQFIIKTRTCMSFSTSNIYITTPKFFLSCAFLKKLRKRRRNSLIYDLNSGNSSSTA